MNQDKDDLRQTMPQQKKLRWTGVDKRQKRDKDKHIHTHKDREIEKDKYEIEIRLIKRPVE